MIPVKRSFPKCKFLEFCCTTFYLIKIAHFREENSDIFSICTFCTTTQTNFTSIISYPVIRDFLTINRDKFSAAHLGLKIKQYLEPWKCRWHTWCFYLILSDWDEENLCLEISSGIIHNLTNSDYVINSY